MRRVSLLFFLAVISLIPHNALAWGNGGFSSDPSRPNYGTHDWIADHALDYLPLIEKQWLLDHRNVYLYGTELPDNGRVPDGYGDTARHHVYFHKDGSLQEAPSAQRAQALFQDTLSAIRNADFSLGAKLAGAMTHYIDDVAVFAHVIGAASDWGPEKHHQDYEGWMQSHTGSYSSDVASILPRSIEIQRMTAEEATVTLAYDTTFGDRVHTALWMDQNYNTADPEFVSRAYESLILAVTHVALALHSLWLDAGQPIPELPQAAFTGAVLVLVLLLLLPRKRWCSETMSRGCLSE